MTRLFFLLPLALMACATAPRLLPLPDTEVRPVVAKDKLQGRWNIIAVNGERAGGLWLELGGEGPTTVTSKDGSTLIGAPQPRTQAFLGCNSLHLNGWTRNGDKLLPGSDYAFMTERGCDPATMTREAQAHAILIRPMTMELTPPDRLRLINEYGTLDLVRGGR
jgi:hypothetical protein